MGFHQAVPGALGERALKQAAAVALIKRRLVALAVGQQHSTFIVLILTGAAVEAHFFFKPTDAVVIKRPLLAVLVGEARQAAQRVVPVGEAETGCNIS